MAEWKYGRQGTGYLTKTYIGTNVFDLCVIKYPPGTCIPPHTDKLDDGRKHYRLNILLSGEDSFKCENVIFKWWRFTFFRPDINEHYVPPVKSQRMLLSIGFAI